MASNDRGRQRERGVRFESSGDDLPPQRRHYYFRDEPQRRHRRDGRGSWMQRRGPVRVDNNPYSRTSTYDGIAAPIPRQPLATRLVARRPVTITYNSQDDSVRPVSVLQQVVAGIEPADAIQATGFRYTESPAPIEHDKKDQHDQGRQPIEYQWIKRDSVESDQWPRRYPGREPTPPRVQDDPLAFERDGNQAFIPGDRRTSPQPEDEYSHHRPLSPLIEDMDAFDEFRFVFPSPQVSRDDISDPESPSSETESTRKPDSTSPSISMAPGVYSSSYIGSAELGGSHKATVTVIHDPKGKKKPFFRWLHIRQDVMNFDEFWSEVSRQVRFSEGERSAIAKLRADVKRRCVKSRYNPKGSKVGYMEPRYISIPLESSKKKASSDSRAVSWICLPYFSLQKYTGLLSASTTTLFPTQTLLQSQYSRNTQQRDMEQAVCQLGLVPQGECFHIAQLWCLVIDNNVLVTCGNMEQSDLQCDYLKINSEPGQGPTGTVGSGKILVSYGGSVMWSFTTKECPTWFSFISHFHAFWPQTLEFRRHHHALTANNWSKVLKLADGPRGSVKLTLNIVEPPDPPRAFLKPENKEQEGSHERPKKLQQSPEYLHVLTLVPGGAEPSKDGVLESLHGQLTAAEKFLTEQTSYSVQRGYKNCQDMTRSGVYADLTKLATRVEEIGSDLVRRSYDERIDIFNAADILFQMFFPSTFEGPTTGKFWGALSKLMEIPELDGQVVTYDIYSTSISDIKTSLWQISQEILAFQSIMSYAGKDERDKVELPHEFVTAWLHVVSGMIYGTNGGGWQGHITKAKLLVREGMQKVIQGISNQNLLDKAVMLPMEVMSLICLKLLQDQVGKYEDICETYSQYLNLLDTDITTKPSDRSYQHQIDLVQQEMTAIKRSITRQQYVISALRNKNNATDGGFAARYGEEISGQPRYPVVSRYHTSYERPTGRVAVDYDRVEGPFLDDLEMASKLSSTDAGGFRSLFLAECANIVEQREYEFRRYTEYAEDLEREINYKMEWTKDRQENAIYAFTIVTIIFLPISAVSGIFGMNTNDVRNMEFDQWLYWAVALPVTFIVIIAGLWWMNELGNVVRWFTGKKSTRSTRYKVAGDTVLAAPPQPITVPNSVADIVDVPVYRRRQRLPALSRAYTSYARSRSPSPEPFSTAPSRRRRDTYYRY